MTAAWTANLARFRRLGTTVRYLLLAEAPPRPQPKGVVHYFYTDFHGAWCGRIWSAFCPGEKRPTDLAVVLDQLASQGLLMIDTLPFAMKYSTSMRRRPEYVKLVRACSGFLQVQLDHAAVPWGEDPKIALAFMYSGLGIIKAYPKGISIQGRKRLLDEGLITDDRSGLTSPGRLREVFGLNDGWPTASRLLVRLEFFRDMALRLRDCGQSPEEIRASMKKALDRLDDHTFEHLYRRSVGLPIPDDFAAVGVTREETDCVGMVRLTAKKAIPAIPPGGIVQYREHEWLVAKIDGRRYTLQEIR